MNRIFNSISIFSLILFLGTSSVVADDPEKKILIKLAKQAETLNNVVSSASHVHANDCNESHDDEELLPLLRQVATPDPRIKPLACPVAPSDFNPGTPAQVQDFLNQYNMTLVDPLNQLNPEDLKAFIFEARKFPPHLMNAMKNRNSQIRLVVGTGVASDPSWLTERDNALRINTEYQTFHGNNPEATNESISRFYETNPHGRSQTLVPGGGGSPRFNLPTRIVIPNLYAGMRGSSRPNDQGHGSANLFLHEYGHTLDNLNADGGISDSTAFREVFERSRNYLNKVMTAGDMANPHEAFPEIFSYFHSCEGPRNQMLREAPELANFIQNLTVGN